MRNKQNTATETSYCLSCENARPRTVFLRRCAATGCAIDCLFAQGSFCVVGYPVADLDQYEKHTHQKGDCSACCGTGFSLSKSPGACRTCGGTGLCPTCQGE